jgi:hypothetical protein
MNETANVQDVDETDDEIEGGGEYGGEESREKARKLVNLLVVGRMRRHQQLRKLLLAHLIKERAEGAEDEDEEIEGGTDYGGDEEHERARKLVNLLVVGRMRRHRQLRKLLLAHLLKERAEGAEEEDDEIEGGADYGDDEGSERARKLVSLLVVGRMRRHRQLRKLLLAHLIRERMEGAEEEDDEIEGGADYGDDEGSERARKLVGLLIVGRTHRHRQLRKLLLAHLIKERMEGSEEEDEGDEGHERARKLARTLIAGRMHRQKQLRRVLAAYLAHENE